MPNIYPIDKTISLPIAADKRRSELSLSELRQGYRVIGGDKGDLLFNGYDIDGRTTILNNPRLRTTMTLTPMEASEIAENILLESFDAIGIETVEHS